MTTTTELVGPGKNLERDRYGRPLIIPPSGGKPVAYTRCTTYVGALEDTFNLSKWQQRMVAQGLANRPDLMLAVSALPLGNLTQQDKQTLNGLCEQAMEAAAANAAATVGTALHALAERHDRGEELGPIPEQYRADLEAYKRETAHLEMVQIETFGVHDTLRIGGTWDRIVRIDGQNYIADLKTGSIEYGIGKIAMQLAVYSRCQQYDTDTGTRTPLPGVHPDRALIIHLPAGKGAAELVWVDIAAGWEAVNLATQVRAWRARRDLTRPYVKSTTAATDAGTEDEAATALHLAIQAAGTVDDLNDLWEAHHLVWTDAHTAAAAAKKTSLTATAA